MAKGLEAFDESECHDLYDDWYLRARDEQLPPPGNWRIWLFLGGRGAGKTRSGAEWIAEGVDGGAMQRIGLIGATHSDARAVMIEGVSGLLSVAPGANYEPSNRRVLFPNGAIATVLSADEPDAIRGHQFDACWLDEWAKHQDPQATLDMALMALRLGEDPRMLVTTTPRAIEPMLNLRTMPDVAVTVSRTKDNASNLAPGFLETMEKRYLGSRLGRQELDAEIIEDNDAALWRREWIESTRIRIAPALQQVVVAIDPAVSISGDETGIIVAGKDAEGQGYVLADLSIGGVTPSQWAARAANAFVDYKADRVIAEANNGGDTIKSVLANAQQNLPVQTVHATRDKRTRAQPIATLYEQRRIHHIGVHAELEDQLCNYDGEGSSPDRLDALVWALTYLFPITKTAEPRIRTF
ncbi:MAG: DNA-packaging protein [Alphaproteobacteria bacterium]|nr:DNA-packaging protein [Alphaproteobacteria bacterium]MBL7097840.1 DNA-packaging protein [Alphaproteobacteria bacterium]